MIGISVQKMNLYHIRLGAQQACEKVTKMIPFRHKMGHIKTINLTQKYFASC